MHPPQVLIEESIKEHIGVNVMDVRLSVGSCSVSLKENDR